MLKMHLSNWICHNHSSYVEYLDCGSVCDKYMMSFYSQPISALLIVVSNISTFQ